MKLSYTVSPHAQGTPEWLAARAGRLNGSEVAAIYTTIKSGEAAARRDLRLKMVLERLTGKPQGIDFVSKDMQWGIDHEAEARMSFEMDTGLTVAEMGFCAADSLMVGMSPDGVIEDGGLRFLAEFKCPKSATHLGYLNAGPVIPTDYIYQCLHGVWLLDLDGVYFQSYDPRFPAKMQRHEVKLLRNQMPVAEHERMVLQFLKEVDAQEKEMRDRFGL